MSKRNQHVVPHPQGWAVKGEGASKATSVHPTQAQATQAGSEIARNQGTELLIHRGNGQIRARSSFGHDPYPPEG